MRGSGSSPQRTANVWTAIGVIILLVLAVIAYNSYIAPRTGSPTVPLPQTGVTGSPVAGAGQPATTSTATTTTTTGGSSLGKNTDYTAKIPYKYQTGYLAAGTVSLYASNVDPANPASGGSIDSVTAGSKDTNDILVCGSQYKLVFANGATTYAISRYGTSNLGLQGNSKDATAGTIACPDTTSPTASVTDVWNEQAVNVATPDDPLAENSLGGTQALNGNTTANTTTTWIEWGSSAASSTRCIAVGKGSGPLDNDPLYFNDTHCSGTFSTDFDLGLTGAAAGSGWRQPTLCFTDGNFNLSSAAITTATLTPVSGSGFISGSKTVTVYMQSKGCFSVNDYVSNDAQGALTGGDIKYGTKQTVRLTVAYVLASWPIGARECLFAADLGGVNAYQIVTANTGFAEGAGNRICWERGAA